MARLSRKHKNTIVQVISRWAETYAGERPVNHDRIRELIDVAYKQKKRCIRTKTRRGRQWKEVKLAAPKIHYLRSPIALQIAQAVVRGRMGKAAAERVCQNYGIDKSFVAALRRDTMIDSFGHRHWRCGSSALSDVWEATIAEASKQAQIAAFEPSPDPSDDSHRGRELRRAYQRLSKYFPDRPGLSKVDRVQSLQNNHFRDLVKSNRKIVGNQAVYSLGNFACHDVSAKDNQTLADVPWSSNANNATLSRCERASPNGYGSNYMDAEIAYKLFGVKDVKQIWAYELMHEAHVVMMFQKQVLVLVERPTVHLNADGELHNDEGPAVHWADGAKQYYIDGHALGAIGEFVVEKPSELTLAHINQEENEEIKRIAIDRFGWGRYLEQIGATVVDRRDNAIDNTIEALVNIRTKIKRRQWGWNGAVQETEIQQRKLILSCRSTARQYFLAVPEDTRSCEAGQRWMAEGANTRLVAALNHPVRVIGAS